MLHSGQWQSIIMLNVDFAECYMLAFYAEWCYAECRYANCRGAVHAPACNGHRYHLFCYGSKLLA
jgi:hypothetical protein